MARITITIDEKTIKQLIADHLGRQLGDLTPALDQIKIEVKSSQNYRSEWEQAHFRATFEGDL